MPCFNGAAPLEARRFSLFPGTASHADRFNGAAPLEARRWRQLDRCDYQRFAYIHARGL